MNTLSNQSFKGVFVKLFDQKSCKFPRKMSAVESVLIKVHNNVSNTGLRHCLFLESFQF